MRVTYEISGPLTAFHASEAGGLIICISGAGIFDGIDPAELQRDGRIGAVADVSITLDVPVPDPDRPAPEAAS